METKATVEVEKEFHHKTFVTHISLARPEIAEARLYLRVLDHIQGRPAARLPVTLFGRNPHDDWQKVEDSVTDQSGTCCLLTSQRLEPQTYRIHLHTASYFTESDVAVENALPYVEVTLRAREGSGRLIVEVQISPCGHSVFVTTLPGGVLTGQTTSSTSEDAVVKKKDHSGAGIRSS